jgi:hypothetical protein
MSIADDTPSEPDFADEHGRTGFADQNPPPEGPDEAVPTGSGGDGGMDLDPTVHKTDTPEPMEPSG